MVKSKGRSVPKMLRKKLFTQIFWVVQNDPVPNLAGADCAEQMSF